MTKAAVIDFSPARRTMRIRPEISCSNCGIHSLCTPLGLDRPDMSLLERVVRRKEAYRRGSVLFRSGQRFEHLYAIRSGSVKTFVATGDGRVQITGLHVPGELLGLSAMGTMSYTYDAIALEATSVCKVTMELLEEVAAQMPEIHHQLLRIMSNQIVDDGALMLLLGKRSAEERLAAFLLGLSRRFARREFSPTRFRLSMSRADIGNYLGLAEETVSRLLARFRSQGVLSVRGRQVQLNDLALLHELSGGLPVNARKT